MVVFNQTFYDLNHKRGYCVDGALDFPTDTISDLKISVPNDTDTIWLQGLYMIDETVRLVFTAKSSQREIPVALFTSNSRSSLRIGEIYSLRSIDSSYVGLIVFGSGIRNDCEIRSSFPVSEECYTRYESSGIPFVGRACDNLRLTGEVQIISGDESRVVTEGCDLDKVTSPFVIADRGLRIRLLDTDKQDMTNPMIEAANGINSYFGTETRESPIFQLFGATPDAQGQVRFAFDKHFHLAYVTDDLNDSNPSFSRLAIGTDITMEDVCESGLTAEPGDVEEVCHPSDIQFEIVDCDKVQDTPP